MAFVKQDRQPKNPATNKSSSMLLTPKIVRDAKRVVSIYDRIDWETVRKAECDAVHLHFQTPEAAQVAVRILREMAAGELGLRNKIASEIKKAFKDIFRATDFSKTGGDAPAHHSAPRVEKLLSDILATGSPRRFAKLCIEASTLYRDINSVVWRKQRRQVKSGSAKIPPPLPLPGSVLFWLGPSGDLWLSVPARLAFAEPVVGLCRRIAEINTGETSLHFEPGEEDLIRLHHRLWTECNPRSYCVPVDDLTHPFCHQLQKILNAFLPKVQKLVRDYVNQVKAPEFAAVTDAPPALAIAEVQVEMIEPKLRDAGETPAATKQAASPQGSKVGKTQSSQKRDQKLISIQITETMVVIVDGKKVANAAPARAFLTIAALIEKPTELRVSTRDFVALAHGATEKISNKWGKYKDLMVARGIKAGKVRNGVWHLSGFRVALEQLPDRRAIREELQRRNHAV